MLNRLDWKLGALMLALTGFVTTAAGCPGGDDDNGAEACGLELNAKINATVAAAGDLQASADALVDQLIGACEGIVTDLDGTLPAANEDRNAYVEAVCSAAADAITDVRAGASVSIAINPPVCTVDAQAQFDCEASCDVSGSCEPGTVEARCDAGDLSVVCEGECSGGATCEATATAEAQCEGTCSGVCTGECSGATNAAGECEGTCTGTCSGSCELNADASINCGAEARCTGGCEVEGSAPECRAELEAPSCDLDADCAASCEGQASFNAECTEGSIEVVVTGGSNAEALAATLKANLPTILATAEGVQLIAGNAQGLIDAGASVTTAVAALPACGLAKAAQLSAALQGAASAAVSVNVSVSVSASVSGSATAG